VLGVSTGTVKSRCARGRARLAPLLMHLAGQARRTAGPAARAEEPAGPVSAAEEPAGRGAVAEEPAAQAEDPAPQAAEPAQRNRRAVRRVSSSQGPDPDGSRPGAGVRSGQSERVEPGQVGMPTEGGAT
jgi:hypothetical protein